MQLERIAVVDVETTGFSPSRDRIVEIGCILIDGTRVGTRWSTLVNPGVPIPAHATAVHGIDDGMVAGAPSADAALAALRRLCRDRTIAAHCAHFDLAFLGARFPAEGVCTMRLARALFPEAPNHKNQTLRAFLGIDALLDEPIEAHRALDDAIVSTHVLLACRRRFHDSFHGEDWKQFILARAMVRSDVGRVA